MFSCLIRLLLLHVCSWAQINVQDESALACRVRTAQAHLLPNCNYRVLSLMDLEFMSLCFLYSRNEIKATHSHTHTRPTETCSSISKSFSLGGKVIRPVLYRAHKASGKQINVRILVAQCTSAQPPKGNKRISPKCVCFPFNLLHPGK